MILNEKNEQFTVNGIVLKVGDNVVVSSRSGDYSTKVVKEFFSYTLEENLTEFKDSACLYAIKNIL